MSTERRAQARNRSFHGKAYLTFKGRCRCEEVIDLSEGGMLLHSRARVEAGDLVSVFLPLRFGKVWRLCLLKGSVVRRASTRGGASVAIALRPDAEDARELLGAFLAAA